MAEAGGTEASGDLDERDRGGRDPLASANGSQRVCRGGTHPDQPRLAAQRPGHGCLHCGKVRRESWTLRNNDHLGTDDGGSGGGEEFGDSSQEDLSAGVAPAVVSAREVPPHIPKPGGAEQRITERMDNRVTVGVTLKTDIVRNVNASKPQLPPGNQAMNVDAVAHAKRHDPRIPRSHTRSSGTVILRLRGSPSTTATGWPRASTSTQSSEAS